MLNEIILRRCFIFFVDFQILQLWRVMRIAYAHHIILKPSLKYIRSCFISLLKVVIFALSIFVFEIGDFIFDLCNFRNQKNYFMYTSQNMWGK